MGRELTFGAAYRALSTVLNLQVSIRFIVQGLLGEHWYPLRVWREIPPHQVLFPASFPTLPSPLEEELLNWWPWDVGAEGQSKRGSAPSPAFIWDLPACRAFVFSSVLPLPEFNC